MLDIFVVFDGVELDIFRAEGGVLIKSFQLNVFDYVIKWIFNNFEKLTKLNLSQKKVHKGSKIKKQNNEEHNLRKAVVLGSVIASFNVEDFSFNKLKQISEPDIYARFDKMKEITRFD